MRRVAGRLSVICTIIAATLTAPLSIPFGAFPSPATSRIPMIAVAEAAPRSAKPKKEPPAEVSVAEQLYAKLAYDDANHVAARVLEKHGLSHDELVRTLRVLAITHAVLNHEDAARDAFVQLLTVSPDDAIDANLGPKVTGPFYEARGYWRAQPSRPGIDATATLPATTATSKGVQRVSVTMRDPTHVVVQVNVGYRWGHAGDFTASTVAIKSGEPTTISLPASPAGETDLDYYAQALDEREDVVFESGSPGAPKTSSVDVAPIVTPPPPSTDAKHEGGSVFTSAPFWIVVGAVVVGGAVVTYLVARPKDQEPATSATLTPQLYCGSGTRCQ